MALAPGPLIQPQEAMARQGHLPRPRQLVAADHADSGDGVMRGAEGAGGDEGGAPAGQGDDAVDPGALPCVRQAHRR